MRFIFIIQGEGRGHLTQALVLQQIISRHGDELVGVMVGKSNHREIPAFFKTKINVPVYSFESPNFLPSSQHKKPSLVKSTIYNLCRTPKFLKSMQFIRQKTKQLQPDIIINFYELLTGLTYFFRRPQSPIISIGHQYLFLHKDYTFPQKSKTALIFLRFFTRLTALGSCCKFAPSFYDFPNDPEADILVIPPLLREEILTCKPTKGEYIHGYFLNEGYAREVMAWHTRYPSYPLHFFWDKKEAPETCLIPPNLTLHKINDRSFIHYMAGCKAFATTAGFESVCEALFLQKPVFMIPVHIEQECNALDAVRVGAGIRSSGFIPDDLLHFTKTYRPNPLFKKWVLSAPERVYDTITDVYSNFKSREKRSTAC